MKNVILNFLSDLKQNYKTLILAFLLSFAMWMVVSIQVFPTKDMDINGVVVETLPTEYMVQNNLQIVNDIADTVDIKIQGKRYDISGLTSADFYASVDLSAVRSAGTVTLPLVVLPKSDRDCSVLEVTPKAVTLEIDEIITREFTISGTAPDIILPEGYYVSDDNITTSPETISITGSAAMLEKIKRVEARSTYHGDVKESVNTNSEIFLYGDNGTKIVSDKLSLSTESVMVNIPVYKQKELPLIITVNYPQGFDADSLAYEIMPSSIIVASPDSSIDNLSELNIGMIDLADANPYKMTFSDIRLPEGYKNLSGNQNARIVWKMENYGMLDYTVSDENIVIINSPDNYDVSLITKEISVTVTGPSDLITNFAQGDITATVNLLGVTLREGSQDVGVSLQIKGEKQKCWVTGAYKVTINALPV